MNEVTSARTLIGVFPGRERQARARLFDAFEQAYPVAFAGLDEGGAAPLDAVLRFPGAGASAYQGEQQLPSLTFHGEESPRGGVRNLRLAAHRALSRPLRDAHLTEAHASGVAPVPGAERAETIGLLDGDPAWTLTNEGGVDHHQVALAPADLAEGDVLRSRLAPRRTLAVLAMTQFIRNLVAGVDWELPQPSATFVFDDPNLRRLRYGHIDFGRLALSAKTAGYHVAIAMVPLDARAHNGRAVSLFKLNTDQLSLCIHGNDHLPDELTRPTSSEEGRVPVAQAVQRAMAFEQRTGLTVDRVMVAPHEQLGAAATQALLDCGYEAYSGTRTYPWMDYAHDLPWLSRPAGSDPLVGWRPVELVDGLPALLRIGFEHHREELAIRAFLGQPLIMYGHDSAVRGGTALLEDAAAAISSVGEVSWSSLSGIARRTFKRRLRGDRLDILMAGRRITFETPPGVSEVFVHIDVPGSSAGFAIVDGAVTTEVVQASRLILRLKVQEPGPVDVSLRAQVDPTSVVVPPTGWRPMLRRALSEGRDRTRPMLGGRKPIQLRGD